MDEGAALANLGAFQRALLALLTAILNELREMNARAEKW